MSTTSAATPDAATTRRAFALSILATLVWTLDVAITQLILPEAQKSLGMSFTDSQWIFAAGLTGFVAFGLIGGWVGDSRGPVLAFRVGAALYAVSCTAGIVLALGGNGAPFILTRLVCGVAAAMLMPAAVSIMTQHYPRQQLGSALGRAFGLTMVVTALTPVAMGVVIGAVGFAWAYVPMVLVALTVLVLARGRSTGSGRPLDVPGALLAVVGPGLLVVGLMQAGASGWTSPFVVASLAIGGMAVAGFAFVELRRPQPLLDVRVFGVGTFLVAFLVMLLGYLPQTLNAAFLLRYVQEVLGVSATVAAVTSLITTLTIFALSGVAGGFYDRRGARTTFAVTVVGYIVASLLLGVGFWLASFWALIPGLVTIGAATAFQASSRTEGQLAVTPAQRGSAASVFSLAGQFGTALSVAVLTTVQVQLVSRALAEGLTDPVEISARVLVPMAIGSTVVIALLLIPITRLPHPAADALARGHD